MITIEALCNKYRQIPTGADFGCAAWFVKKTGEKKFLVVMETEEGYALAEKDEGCTEEQYLDNCGITIIKNIESLEEIGE